jgi:4-amino-4-deoxychorismate lyase
MPRAVLVNGVPAESISVHDRGLQYGDGLFETIAVKNGVPLLWERHLDRLRLGAQRLAMALPEDDRLATEAQSLCRGIDRAVLKFLITRGVSERGYRPPITAEPLRVLYLSDWPIQKETDGNVNVRLCRTRLAANPLLAGIKHLNRLEQVLARAEWGDDHMEGLMLDVDGNVVAGTACNVFAVINGILCTPDLSHAGVAGVMRGLVLERAAALGIRCQITTVTLENLERAGEIFLTSSLIGVLPVTRLEAWDYKVGNIAQTLHNDLAAAGFLA